MRKNGISKPKILLSYLTVAEPNDIQEARLYDKWHIAVDDEYNGFVRNQTWSIVPLPPNRHAVGCKWVFKLRRHLDGSILDIRLG